MKKLSNEYETSIADNLLAIVDESPVNIMIEGERFIPVYTTKSKLEDSMSLIGIEKYTIKKIDDAIAFRESVLPMIRIARDPYIHDGNTRFTEIK